MSENQGEAKRRTGDDVEKYVLGAMLREQWAADVGLGTLREYDFYHQQHKHIYQAISKYSKTSPEVWDEVAIHRKLVDLTDAVPIGYIHQLQMGCPSPTNVKSYCSQVLEDSRRRHVEALMIGGTELIATGMDTDTTVDYLRKELDLLSKGLPSSGVTHIKAVGEAAVQLVSNPTEPAPYGLEPLDSMMGGMYGGELVIVGARPSVGKSALALQMALNAAKQGVTTAFMTLEMTPLALYLRVASMRRGIPIYEFRTGTDRARHAIEEVKQEMQGLPLIFVDKSSLTVDELNREMRQLVMAHGAQLIMLDYIGLLKFPDKASRSLELGYATQMLKQIALEFNIPIVAFSQLNRQSEQRESGIPRLSDLRDSGALEQDADVVLLLHRKVLQEENDTTLKAAKILVAKNRQGKTGVVDVFWNPETVQFLALTRREE
mgnify:FL=1